MTDLDNGVERPQQSPATLTTLDQDSLQELFARCHTLDVCTLRQTCKAFNAMLSESQIVWARRLWADYGLSLALQQSAHPDALATLAKAVHEAPPTDELRFQGVLVNGSVDELNMTYWVDNLFTQDRRPFCSDSSYNIDCLGLLLDGVVPRDNQYAQVRRYMQRRCRYAAALLEQVHNPPGADNADLLMRLVERWSDHQLEHFFRILVANLEGNHAMGRLLLYDIPHERHAEEQQRLRAVCGFLRDRPGSILKDIVQLPGDLKTLFDGSVMDKVGKDQARVIGILNEVALSRYGSLTCPVAAGVVLAGIIDHSLLANLTAKEVAERIQRATQDPLCLAFNSLQTLGAVEHQVARGALPPIASVSTTQAGILAHFDAPWDAAAFDNAWLRGTSGTLIQWKPLAWFRFHSREDADAFLAEQQDMQGAGMEEAEPAAAAAEAAVGAANAAAAEEAAAAPSDTMSLDDLIEDMEGEGGESDEEGEGDEEEEEEGDGGEADIEIDGEDRTQGRNLLTIQLARPVAANVLMIKLIDQENLMEELSDPHSFPNVDMTSIIAKGKKVGLPQGVALKPAQK